MNILAIGAHPDDIEIGCSATLCKYNQKGHQVFTLVMTDGGMGGDSERRREEQMTANRLIGVNRTFWGGYKDTQLPLDNGAIKVIEEVSKKTDPAFIFVN